MIEDNSKILFTGLYQFKKSISCFLEILRGELPLEAE